MRTVDELITAIDGLAAARKRATLAHPATVSRPPSSVADTSPTDTHTHEEGSAAPLVEQLRNERPRIEAVKSQDAAKSQGADLESTSAPPKPKKAMRHVGDFEQLDDTLFIKEAYDYLLN